MNTKRALAVFLLVLVFSIPAFGEVIKGYYPSGKLMTEQNLKNGKQEGINKKYYKNGKIQAELNFKNGKQEGISKEYHENGRIRFIDTCKAGKMINRKSYSRKGNLEFDQDYQYVE